MVGSNLAIVVRLWRGLVGYEEIGVGVWRCVGVWRRVGVWRCRGVWFVFGDVAVCEGKWYRREGEWRSCSGIG